jgi:hypothetical protein
VELGDQRKRALLQRPRGDIGFAESGNHQRQARTDRSQLEERMRPGLDEVIEVGGEDHLEAAGGHKRGEHVVPVVRPPALAQCGDEVGP